MVRTTHLQTLKEQARNLREILVAGQQYGDLDELRHAISSLLYVAAIMARKRPHMGDQSMPQGNMHIVNALL